MNDPLAVSRRSFLEGAVGLGGLALLPFGAAAEAERRATFGQVMGPFYPVNKLLDQDADLTTVAGKQGRAEGELIHVVGRVVNRAGEPVPGARLEIWQANTHGRYAHESDINPAPLDENFQGYAAQETDANGEFRFKTIKPAPYPINPINPGAIRPAHIHFDITGHHDRVVTQMYFPNDPLHASDDILRSTPPEFRDALIARLAPPTPELEPDSVIARWDVVLERG
jgi:protocatechuate 3,4-dioxygenase beta subunit